MKYVMRCKTVQPDGVGWVTNEGRVTSNPRYACKYDTEADAWIHADNSGLIGSDERGDWCWVEEITISSL